MVYPCNFKSAAVKAYEYISSLRKVSKIFSVSISTLSRWNKARTHGTLFHKNTRYSKMSNTVVAFIKQSVGNNPFMTRKVLKNMIYDVFGISASEALVGTVIKRCGFTRKKTRSRPCKFADPHVVENFLSDFTKAVRLQKTIVSIDETGFDDTSLPLMGYSSKGCRLVIKHPRTSWKRMSTMAAVCTSGTIDFSMSDKPVNSEIFENFLSSLNLPKDSVLLLDNIAFHKTKKVRALANTRGWQLLFTPPYSPWANPIENVFSVVKNTFRHVNARDIIQGVSSSAMTRRIAVRDAFATVTPELIMACFRHVDDLCCSATYERGKSELPSSR